MPYLSKYWHTKFKSQHSHMTFLEIDLLIIVIISTIILPLLLVPEKGYCQLLAKVCAQSTG